MTDSDTPDYSASQLIWQTGTLLIAVLHDWYDRQWRCWLRCFTIDMTDSDTADCGALRLASHVQPYEMCFTATSSPDLFNLLAVIGESNSSRSRTLCRVDDVIRQLQITVAVAWHRSRTHPLQQLHLSFLRPPTLHTNKNTHVWPSCYLLQRTTPVSTNIITPKRNVTLKPQNVTLQVTPTELKIFNIEQLWQCHEIKTQYSTF